MKRIAMYGKGGIGKSTIAANLSAAMALKGSHVLQVGCDPKQDSTRLLLRGRTITTALEYLRATPPHRRRLEDIVHTGFAGVSCVEAGGPGPGIGCAGRGILSTFDLLEQLGIDQCGYDKVLYDVLGDVVCGGFAVPLRADYAELVFIVTSGEFMALYAGNNILRGIRNYEGRGPRVGGLVFNERGLEDEADRIRRFAEAVDLPVVARFPRNERFSQAERAGRTVMEVFPEADLAQRFRRFADYIIHDPVKLPAHPLTAEDLERVVLHKGSPLHIGALLQEPPTQEAPSTNGLNATIPVSAGPHPPPKRYCSKSVRTQVVLFGCAFNGAAHTVMQVLDAAVVIYGPRSCAHLSAQGMVSAARRVWDRYGLNLDRGRHSSVHCSHMDENTVIFGGNHSLEETIRKAAARHSGPIFVVTTCASGIIGDDARLVLETIRNTSGRKPVSLIAADGDITGDYMQGVLDAMRTVAEDIIDPQVQPEAGCVNIIGEKNLATNTEENFQVIRELLEALGLRVNCRFIRRCTSEELTHFQRAELNLLAHDDVLGREVRRFLTDHYAAPFASHPFPVGLRAASDWLREVAARFDREASAETVVAERCSIYGEHVARLRPALEGKRLFVATQNHRIDWVLDTALDLGMEVLKVGILESVWDDSFLSRYDGRVPMVFPYPREQREQDLRRLNSDLMLINYPWRDLPDGYRFDHIPVCPDVGFLAGIALAERWQQLMKIPAREGWRRDLHI